MSKGSIYKLYDEFLKRDDEFIEEMTCRYTKISEEFGGFRGMAVDKVKRDRLLFLRFVYDLLEGAIEREDIEEVKKFMEVILKVINIAND